MMRAKRTAIPILAILCIVNSTRLAGQCDVEEIFANETTNAVCFETENHIRHCYSNNIPDHEYGPFGGGNTIEGQDFHYTFCLYPELGDEITPLIEDPSSQDCGNGIIFGVSMQGVNYSPFARLYWVNPETQEENLSYHVEADFTLRMDLNGGHVNAINRYHYHNVAADYFSNDLMIDGTGHSPIVGYAADGFPIYYRYLYSNSSDASSAIVPFESSYALKDGMRSGDGVSAPDGTYDGTYVEDYEYVASLSELDECGGRYGVTPEYPDGTYYYVLTDNWPFIPRCLKGKHVDNSFRLGPNCPPSSADDDCSSTTSNVIPVKTVSVAIEISHDLTNNALRIIPVNGDDDVVGITIYDVTGAVHYRGGVPFERVIGLERFDSGIYFVQVRTERGEITKKIVL